MLVMLLSTRAHRVFRMLLPMLAYRALGMLLLMKGVYQEVEMILLTKSVNMLRIFLPTRGASGA